MEAYIGVLERCPLFAGLDRPELLEALGCLEGRVVRVRRGQCVLSQGSAAQYVGVVLEGAVQVVRDDFYGARDIQARAEAGELFGESFACAEVNSLPVSVEAETDSRILLLKVQRLTRTCERACAFHNRLIRNLMGVLAQKNLILNRKIQITSRRTIRDKLMAYLTDEAARAGSDMFMIPFDRQGLADYLGVDRSALSAEIGRLRREGILESERSAFKLMRRGEAD